MGYVYHPNESHTINAPQNNLPHIKWSDYSVGKKHQVVEKGIFFMMNKQPLIFDEKKYPITWRFNSVDCSLSDEDKHKIIFLIQDESKKLWDSLFPFNNLMEIKENYFLLAEKKDLELDFDEEDRSRDFFAQKLQTTELLIFFGEEVIVQLFHQVY